jgi:hypothetical protein
MALNTHTNTTPNSSRKRIGVSINLKPTNSELVKLSDLQTAIDTLICQNNFVDSNPMRMNGNDTLFWDWAIVSVNGFSIPTPIHTENTNDSVLYTASGREVLLSHHQCAVTTAYFYFSKLLEFSVSWDKVREFLYPVYVTALSGGIGKVKSLSQEEALQISNTLHDSLCAKGHEVLN